MPSSQETLAQIHLFSDLSKADLKKIERLMTAVDIKKGKEFIIEGKPGREAFILLEGTASVHRGKRLIATLGPGDIIGEMAILAGHPRSATVRAETDIVCEVLDRREFSSLLDEVPTIARKIMVTAIKRLHDLEPGLTS